MSHTRRHIIISSRAVNSIENAVAETSPYDIEIAYTPPTDATPEQVGAEVKRITKKIDQIEHGVQD